MRREPDTCYGDCARGECGWCDSGNTDIPAPLSRDEARASLVRAIELGPAPWVARELALTLARLEYGAGLEHARSRSFYRAFFAEEARREEMRGL